VCVVFGSVKIRHISPWSVYYTRLAGTEIHDEMPVDDLSGLFLNF